MSVHIFLYYKILLVDDDRKSDTIATLYTHFNLFKFGEMNDEILESHLSI